MYNSKSDLDAAPLEAQKEFLFRLAATINKWRWESGEWVLRQDDRSIRRFGFTVEDFPDAPIPPQPDYNPDVRAKEQYRESLQCTSVAGEIVLHRNGLLDAVNQRADSDPEFAIWFKRTTTWRRTSQILIDAYVAITGSEDGLDELFEQAQVIDDE